MRLSEIRGQEQALDRLGRAVSAGRLPHALLFAGPAGVGKATTALALAAALNCESAPPAGDVAPNGCEACGPCARIAQGIHPDVITVQPSGAGNFIVIESIRELIGKLGFPPHEARARVVIVEGADRLNPSAANAFLKTLEEPPARTHFVLVTTAPDRLLVTIRSRCQQIRFAPLGVDAVVDILVRAGTPRDRAREAAALAGGSATRAAALAEGETLEARRERVRAVLDAANGTSVRTAVEAAQALAQAKEELVPTLELVALWYRDAAAVAAGVPHDNLMHRDRADELRAEAARPHSNAATVLARRADRVLAAQTAILGFASPQLTLEHMIYGLREGQ